MEPSVDPRSTPGGTEEPSQGILFGEESSRISSFGKCPGNLLVGFVLVSVSNEELVVS